MPSIITGIIGGIQGASASHNAANSLSAGYGQAGSTVTNAANQVNPGIISAAGTAAGNTAAAGSNVVNSTAGYLAGLNPYTSAGGTAAGQLAGAATPAPFTGSMMEQYSPGYQFQLQQGQQAMQRSQAASGTLQSGGAAKALQQYTQNYANTAYQNAFQDYTTQNQNKFQNLATTAGMGMQGTEAGGQLNLAAQNTNLGATEWAGGANIGATNLAANNSLSAANYLANTQVGSANAQAQGDLGAAAGWNQMLGGIGSAGNMAVGMGMTGMLPGQGGTGWTGYNNPYY